jgi:hypothetical protein
MEILLKIKEMQIKEKAVVRGPFSRCSRMLRKDALPPTWEQHVRINRMGS